MSDKGSSRAGLTAGAAVGVSALIYAVYSRAAWPWVWLGWVGLVPWLLALDRAHRLRTALLLGLVMASAFELAVFGWFALAIADYTGGSALPGVVFLALAGPLLQPQFVTSALARTWARAAGDVSPIRLAWLTAAVYVGTEYLAPKLFGDSLGYPLQGSRWLRQGADIAGAPGLTFLMVAVNECFAAAWRGDRATSGVRGRRVAIAPALVGVALITGLLAYGAFRCRQFDDAPSDAPVVKAGLVQAGLDHYDRMAEEIGRYETVRRILDEHETRSAPALADGGLDVLIWPETVYPTTFGAPKSADGAAFDAEIVDFVTRAGVPLIFGSYAVDGDEEFNAALFLAPGASQPFATYRKTRLFPLTERVPALLDSAWLRRALPWLGTWKPGRGPTVVPLPLRGGATVRVAPMICYDVLDSALAEEAARQGADLFVTLSNDSWFAFGPGPRLHLLGAAFRSIETRRPQVRATNTGVSAVIDATGSLITSADVGERATLVATVRPERRATTPVMRFGEWAGPGSLLVAAGLLSRAWVRRRRGLDSPCKKAQLRTIEATGFSLETPA